MKDGSKIEDELERANAHPAGARPFKRENYIGKFDMLTDGIITKVERDRFIQLVEKLENLSADEVKELNVQIDLSQLLNNKSDNKGIF
jgi:2-methylcitrate dehydratase